MKAWVLKHPSKVENRPLEFTEVATPVPQEGELLVKVKACGICRTDLHVVEGELAVRRPNVVPGHQIVGTVERLGEGAAGFSLGDKVGIAWLRRTCGACRYCLSGRENLCDNAEFTGWTHNGGFAEFLTAPADFVYRLPADFPDVEAAPLLCAGIIGYRALRLLEFSDWSGARLGIYGFGAAGHVCIQIAKSRGAEVFVATRDRERHQRLAEELGAVWVGDTFDKPPAHLDGAIIFAPAGRSFPLRWRPWIKAAVLSLAGSI
jgi:propanol-preferring alcohol dehydrogenase